MKKEFVNCIKERGTGRRKTSKELFFFIEYKFYTDSPIAFKFNKQLIEIQLTDIHQRKKIEQENG